MHTVYKISADDRDVVEEFNAKPIGHHSPALQRVLNVIRGQPVRDKYVLICTKPHKEWTLGQLTGETGPSRSECSRTRSSPRLWMRSGEIFRRRWELHTGEKS